MTDHRNAEAASQRFQRVARVSEVPPGRMLWVDVDGRGVALVNWSGTLYAIDNNCPHRGGPLAQGRFDPANGRVSCPWHAWSCEVESGRVVDPPVGQRILTYEVRVEGEFVLVSRSPR
jgi:nitrite reductase/ring-hydroxylating ferredoxin subunit